MLFGIWIVVAGSFDVSAPRLVIVFLLPRNKFLLPVEYWVAVGVSPIALAVVREESVRVNRRLPLSAIFPYLFKRWWLPLRILITSTITITITITNTETFDIV